MRLTIADVDCSSIFVLGRGVTVRHQPVNKDWLSFWKFQHIGKNDGFSKWRVCFVVWRRRMIVGGCLRNESVVWEVSRCLRAEISDLRNVRMITNITSLHGRVLLTIQIDHILCGFSLPPAEVAMLPCTYALRDSISSLFRPYTTRRITADVSKLSGRSITIFLRHALFWVKDSMRLQRVNRNMSMVNVAEDRVRTLQRSL